MDEFQEWKHYRYIASSSIGSISIVMTFLLKYVFASGPAPMIMLFESGIFKLLTLGLFIQTKISFERVSETSREKNSFNKTMIIIFVYDLTLQILIFVWELGTNLGVGVLILEEIMRILNRFLNLVRIISILVTLILFAIPDAFDQMYFAFVSGLSHERKVLEEDHQKKRYDSERGS